MCVCLRLRNLVRYVVAAGIVYLDDIEAELVKQKLLLEPDTNFDR